MRPASWAQDLHILGETCQFPIEAQCLMPHRRRRPSLGLEIGTLSADFGEPPAVTSNQLTR